MTETDGLKGKRILVVGGETEAGRALVIGLAEAGADIAIASLTANREAEFATNSVLNELWAMGRQGLAVEIDASDGELVRAGVGQAERELGRLDVAAVITTEGGPEVALRALQAALAGREIVTVSADIEADAAVAAVVERVVNGDSGKSAQVL